MKRPASCAFCLFAVLILGPQQSYAQAAGPAKSARLNQERPLTVAAQQSEAHVRGIVVDALGGCVLKAKIVIASRSATRELQSDEAGEFSSALPVGTYRVTIESPGFRVATINRLRVQPGPAKAIKVVLKLRPVKYGKCPKGQNCIWL